METLLLERDTRLEPLIISNQHPLITATKSSIKIVSHQVVIRQDSGNSFKKEMIRKPSKQREQKWKSKPNPLTSFKHYRETIPSVL